MLGDIDDTFWNDMAYQYRQNFSQKGFLTPFLRTFHYEDFAHLQSESITKFNENLEIDSKLLVLASGFYHYYLRQWYEALGKENVLVLSTEDLIANPYRTVKEFEKYFNLVHYFTPTMFVKPYNGSFFCIEKNNAEMWHLGSNNGRRYTYPYKFVETFNPDTRNYQKLHCLGKNKGITRNMEKSDGAQNALRKLKELYRPFNKKLFEIIGKTFDWN